jgi:hypothetical protein
MLRGDIANRRPKVLRRNGKGTTRPTWLTRSTFDCADNDEESDMRLDFCLSWINAVRGGICRHRRDAVGSNEYCLCHMKNPLRRVRHARRVGIGPLAACDASHR